MRHLSDILRNPNDVLPWDYTGWKEEKGEEVIDTQHRWNQTLLSTINGVVTRLTDKNPVIYASMEMIVGVIGSLKKYDYMTSKVDGQYKVVIDKYIPKNRFIVASSDFTEGIIVKVNNMK